MRPRLIERLCALLREAVDLVCELQTILAMHGIQTDNGSLEQRCAALRNETDELT